MSTYGDWSEIWAILTKNAVPSKGSPHVTDKPKIYAMVDARYETIFLPAFAINENVEGRSVIAQGSEDGDRLEELGCSVDAESGRWCFLT